MSQPQAITGEVSAFTDDDIKEFYRRLHVPVDSPRRLLNAVVQEGDLVAYFVTSAEPMPEEEELCRQTNAALPWRKPSTCVIEEIFETSWSFGS
jgi:hypothetical protein